jgi:peroxiredoxin
LGFASTKNACGISLEAVKKIGTRFSFPITIHNTQSFGDDMRHHSLSLVVVFSLCLFWARPARTEDFVSYISTGQPIPVFSLAAVDGGSFDTSTLKGKVILLNFWATWCGPCRMEMPLLEKEIWAKHKGPNFDMIAIARKQTTEEITAFRKTSPYSFPMASDPEGKIYYKFANAGIPRSYVIGPDGKVLFQTLGFTQENFQKMAKIIEKELDKLRYRAP